MRNRNSWKLGLLGTALLLPLVGACRPEAASPPPPAAALSPAPAPVEPVMVAEATQAEQAVTAEAAPAPEPDLANAAVKPITTEKPLPANVRSYGPVAEVIKLTASSVDEKVLLAFVSNSPHLFNPTADEIIYLKDLGIPSSVVTAMMEHDQALRQAGVTSNPAPEVAAPATAPPPAAPAEVAPQYAPQQEAVPAAAPATTVTYAAPAVQVSEPVFYDSLSPYGNWVEVEGYGRCWQPSVVVVNPGWAPYYDGGHWVYTDCGWYWYSDYSWGWAPFHYGRWFRHSRVGWCWAPDNVWGPSWVCWRYNDAHCGWAPLPPGAGFAAGVGLTFHGRHVDTTFSFGLSFDCFTFVAIGHVGDHHLHGYALPHAEARRVYEHSTPHTQFAGNSHNMSNRGLPPERVSAVTHQPLRPVAVRDSRAPVTPGARPDRLASDGKSMTVYRPTMTTASATRSAASSPAGQRLDARSQNGSAPAQAPSTRTATRSTGPASVQTGNLQRPSPTTTQLDRQPTAGTPSGRTTTPAKDSVGAVSQPGIPRGTATTANTANSVTRAPTSNRDATRSQTVQSPQTRSTVGSTVNNQPTTVNRNVENRSPATVQTTPRTTTTPSQTVTRWQAQSPNQATTVTPSQTPAASQYSPANRLETPKATTPTYSTGTRYAPTPVQRETVSPSYQSPRSTPSASPSYQSPRSTPSASPSYAPRSAPTPSASPSAPSTGGSRSSAPSGPSRSSGDKNGR